MERKNMYLLSGKDEAMKIQRMRIYCEVYEQGLETKDYLVSVLQEKGINCEIDIIYTKKLRGEFLPNESIVTRIRKIKDIDIMVTAISEEKEIPIVLIEYSTAVPTDDHIMQRSDVVYWSSKFKVPSLKISPLNKGMDNEHGGGDKITDEFEKRVAIKNNAVYYTLKWQSNEGTDVLLTNEDRLSCIPYSTTLRNYFLKMVDSFVLTNSHFAYFEKLLKEYKSENAVLQERLSRAEMMEMFPTSKRFTWSDYGLTAKINRFGHAMDPDRGIIYFCNMMNGTESTFAEFQVERRSVYGRGGYNSLFDSMANKEEMIKYVSKHKTSFSKEDAKHVFFRGLGIDRYFRKVEVEQDVVKLDDSELLSYLRNASGFALKSIFILSNNIVLTDKKRRRLLTIEYNRSVIDMYIKVLNSFTYEITKIRQLESDDINEDIVTYVSAHLLKAAGMKILSISYPGAQGDRCLLIGEGRNVDREYIDLIAYCWEKDDTINLTLHESKDKLAKSAGDIRKLNSIINSAEKIASLKRLTLKLINNDSISTINIGIGGKGSIMPTGVNLDYVMLFDLVRTQKGVDVLWSIGVINTGLIDSLKPLLNNCGKLSGRFSVGELYRIERCDFKRL